MKNEKSKLQQLGLVEHAHDGGFNESNAFCLTIKAKRALFTELDVKLDDEDRPQRGMMRHSDITAHQLFYDEATSRQVDELTDLLSEDNYQKIHQRLQDNLPVCSMARLARVRQRPFFNWLVRRVVTSCR